MQGSYYEAAVQQIDVKARKIKVTACDSEPLPVCAQSCADVAARAGLLPCPCWARQALL